MRSGIDRLSPQGPCITFLELIGGKATYQLHSLPFLAQQPAQRFGQPPRPGALVVTGAALADVEQFTAPLEALVALQQIHTPGAVLAAAVFGIDLALDK